VSKDGPPISSGYRFGGRAAFQSWLPATALTSKISRRQANIPLNSDERPAENLASFNDYYGRAKSIGQPTPSTQGISLERAAVLQKIERLKEQERTFIPAHSLGVYEDAKLWLYRSGSVYMFVKEYPYGYSKSVIIRNRDRAMWRYHANMIDRCLIEFVKGPLVPPIPGPPNI
jgi:hypothetical protein